MPVLNLRTADLEPDNLMFAAGSLFAVMLYPAAQDIEKRYELTDAFAADIAATKADAGELEFKPGMATWLRSAPKLEPLLQAAGERYLIRSPRTDSWMGGGSAAGHMLYLPLLSMMQKGVRVGVGEVQRDHIRTAFEEKDVLVGASERQLKDLWNTFKPAAHLWAADNILDEKMPDVTAEGLVQIIAQAEALRLLAEGYVPKHAKSALIARGEAWKIEVDFALPLVSFSVNGIVAPEDRPEAETAAEIFDISKMSAEGGELIRALSDEDQREIRRLLYDPSDLRVFVSASEELMLAPMPNGEMVRIPLGLKAGDPD